MKKKEIESLGDNYKMSKQPTGLHVKSNNLDGFLEESLLEFNNANKYSEYMNEYSIELKNFLTYEGPLVGSSTKKLKGSNHQ